MRYKKIKLSSLILLSSIILISSMSISVAGTLPTYVGVSVGDELVWTIDPESGGIGPLIQDYNNSANLGNGQVQLPDWLSSNLIDLGELELAVDITAEGGVGYKAGIPYANLTCSGEFRILGQAISSISPFEIPIFDSSMLYFNETIKSLNGTINDIIDVNDGTLFLIALIVSKSIDWTTLVAEFNQARDALIGSSTDITVSALTSGFQINIVEGFFNESSKEISISMEYDENGILTKGEVKYDDKTAILMTQGESSIPGFEIPLIISVSAITVVGLIYVIKKKKGL
ncbi:MAG: hypothetical protein ACFFBP_12685 [Promethearchaeota archaeon]